MPTAVAIIFQNKLILYRLKINLATKNWQKILQQEIYKNGMLTD